MNVSYFLTFFIAYYVYYKRKCLSPLMSDNFVAIFFPQTKLFIEERKLLAAGPISNFCFSGSATRPTITQVHFSFHRAQPHSTLEEHFVATTRYFCPWRNFLLYCSADAPKATNTWHCLNFVSAKLRRFKKIPLNEHRETQKACINHYNVARMQLMTLLAQNPLEPSFIVRSNIEVTFHPSKQRFGQCKNTNVKAPIQLWNYTCPTTQHPFRP